MDITQADVEGMLRAMRRRKLSGRSQRTALTVTRRVLAYTVDTRLLMGSLADRARQPQTGPVRSMSCRSGTRCAGSSPRPTRPPALFTLIACTGVRPGEALGLEWHNVDLQAGTAEVTGTLFRGRDAHTATKTAPKTVPRILERAFSLAALSLLAPATGLEPVTCRLTAGCSAN